MAFLPSTLVVLAILCGLSGPADAATDKYGITPEEHAACDADVVRLCSAAEPDQDSLIACLKGKRDQLSKLCLTTFTAGMHKRNLPL